MFGWRTVANQMRIAPIRTNSILSQCVSKRSFSVSTVTKASEHENTNNNNNNTEEDDDPYKGVVIPPVSPWHKYGAVALGATFWFWIFYRTKQDWRFIAGLEHPWDSHGDHGDEHHEGEHHHEEHH